MTIGNKTLPIGFPIVERKEIEVIRGVSIPVVPTNGKYNIIYADPAWTFKTYSDKGKGKSAEMHYPCMTKTDIQNLDVNSIAADDCILFIWVTFPCLQEGLELIEKWGFVYKTCGFAWIKKNKKTWSNFWGMGYWTRANVELCLIATKGKPPRESKGVHQVIESRVGRHSEKPAIVREKIVELCGDLPRIELFARTNVEGWAAWGNECVNTIELPVKP